MAEAQYFPSTNASGVQVLVSGVEVEIGDLALIGQVAGLADDHVLSELLRLSPLWSVPPDTAVKGILGFGLGTGAAGPNPATVQPNSLGGGSVYVSPFRAVIGSRQPVSNDPKLAWTDLRSATFTPPGLAQLVTLAPNTGSSVLWDLVYCVFNVDVGAGGVSRRLKTPNSGAPGVTTISQYLGQSLTIMVVPGTLANTIPSMPSDTIGSTYGIALAAVRKPPGFSSSSTVATADIRDQSYPLPLSSTTGAMTLRPAFGNNDFAGTYAGNFSWGSSGRPPMFLPPSLVGGVQVIVEIDCLNSSAASASHPDGSIVDNSIDWRNRFFRTDAQFLNSGVGFQFANDPSGSAGIRLPYAREKLYNLAFISSTNVYASPSNIITETALGSSFWSDSFLGANTALVYVAENGLHPNIVASGTHAGVYCDMTTGALKMSLTNPTPQLRMFLWIQATSQFPNM